MIAKKIATLATASLVGLNAFLASPVQPYTDPTVKPCRTEDSSNCYWTAREQGNGQGRAFLNVNGTTYYGTPSWCKVLAYLPAYHYRYQGARIDVPSGAHIIRAEHPRNATCKALVIEWVSHH